MRRKTVNEGYYSFDAGNGTVQGVSSETRDFIEFEPIIAPITQKRALSTEDAKPRFSLKRDGETFVFGVGDVFEHGKRDSRRRLNSLERVNHADYFMLLDVLYLEAFSQYRGNHDYLAPSGVISLPIALYNDEPLIQDLRGVLVGKREITDYDNCVLSLQIKDENLSILPESAGAMFHYAFDPDTLKKRSSSPISGSTLVIDIGYQTTDVSLFDGMKYIRDASFTVDRAGMGIVARAIEDNVRKVVRGADASKIDIGMRRIAGMKLGAKKQIEVDSDQFVAIEDIYDPMISDLAQRISQAVQTNFGGSVVRALIAGGGAYHLDRILTDMLPFDVVTCPQPERANVYGAYTGLQLKQQR